MSGKIESVLNESSCAHILYQYEDLDRYFQNVIAYISEGIEGGESVILIENERNILILKNQLEKMLSSSQLEKITTINNYDFYQSSGSYHPPAIFEQLIDMNSPYIENNIPFRTWTHVEWGTLENPSPIVEWFERETDKVIHEQGLKVVCAYESCKMHDDLKSSLKKRHPNIMTDENLYISHVYEEAPLK